jgi:hypothetical protein
MGGKNNMNNFRIAGILFQHGEDDYDLWEEFNLTEEEEGVIMAILEKHVTEGCSVRGTYNQIIVED